MQSIKTYNILDGQKCDRPLETTRGSSWANVSENEETWRMHSQKSRSKHSSRSQPCQTSPWSHYQQPDFQKTFIKIKISSDVWASLSTFLQNPLNCTNTDALLNKNTKVTGKHLTCSNREHFTVTCVNKRKIINDTRTSRIIHSWITAGRKTAINFYY